MKNTFLFLFFLYSFNLYGQELQGKVPYMSSNGWSNVREYVTIDTTDYLAMYALNALDIHDEDSYIDLQCLEIGRKTNKYSSRFVYVSDSLRTDYMLDPNAPDTWPNSWMPHGRNGYENWGELKYHVLYVSEGNVRTYTREPKRAYNGYYDEKYPAMKWLMQPETQIICDHTCQKATCSYHGRKFEAWFALDIPFSYGPWKFGGLPGLILKVCDVDHLYTFECVKLQSVHKPIQLVNGKYIDKPIDRNKVLEFERKVNINANRVLQIQHFVSSGNTLKPVDKVFPDVPYEPLELE